LRLWRRAWRYAFVFVRHPASAFRALVPPNKGMTVVTPSRATHMATVIVKLPNVRLREAKRTAFRCVMATNAHGRVPNDVAVRRRIT